MIHMHVELYIVLKLLQILPGLLWVFSVIRCVVCPIPIATAGTRCQAAVKPNQCHQPQGDRCRHYCSDQLVCSPEFSKSKYQAGEQIKMVWEHGTGMRKHSMAVWSCARLLLITVKNGCGVQLGDNKVRNSVRVGNPKVRLVSVLAFLCSELWILQTLWIYKYAVYCAQTYVRTQHNKLRKLGYNW